MRLPDIFNINKRGVSVSNKLFSIIIIVLIAGFSGLVVVKSINKPAETERPGIAQPDKGRKHVQMDAVHYDGPEPPTSGDHSTELQWQAYDQAISDANIIHNLEHGGVYISYRPDLPAEQVAKINALFFRPFSVAKFAPSKALLAPRAANGSPIIMSSWNRSMKLDEFDQQKMMDYYLRNVGKAPEAKAG